MNCGPTFGTDRFASTFRYPCSGTAGSGLLQQIPNAQVSDTTGAAFCSDAGFKIFSPQARILTDYSRGYVPVGETRHCDGGYKVAHFCLSAFQLQE